MSENFEAFISHSVYKRNNLRHYIHVQLGKYIDTGTLHGCPTS